MRVVIIGGGAAGASCATRLRRLNEEVEIIILERTNEVSIANCGLPYYISDVIPNRDSILVSTPQKFKSWFNIDVYLNTEVIEINKKEKFVLTNSNEKLSYDYLVLANGASPIIPDFEGLNKDKTFVIRTLSDADKIKGYIKNNSIKKVAVVGGGFIGIEIVENLIELELDTTLIELSNQILAPVDFEIAKIAQDEMTKKGVNLILADGVQKFSENQIILNSNKVIDYDLCILALGVKPEVDLALKAGLETNRGIIVDEYLKTSDEFIYAAGDNIEAKDFVSGQNTLLPLAGPANRQGRIVADNICGFNSTYKNTQGTSVVKIFDLTVASSGNNEKQLKQKKIPYWKTYVYSRSHAGYYPNSDMILYKLLFSNNGKILGIQGIGESGVEKRVDVIATIMRNNGTVQDMIDAELCYAPPYSSAKDPVNILGMSADNILKGLVKPAYFEDLKDAVIIDVRPNMIYKMGTIDGAINIPIAEIRKRLNEIPKDKKVILSCNTGYTSYCAARILAQKGFNNVYSFMGGYELYKVFISNKINLKDTL
ncbi:MAG: FAD-dependent oxidoreductase [Candidatus Gastranaerophilales bacterium]|nr:FAD-dependent oxidoreductase [Candidatus Gastranaerophilales bacterium]